MYSESKKSKIKVYNYLAVLIIFGLANASCTSDNMPESVDIKNYCEIELEDELNDSNSIFIWTDVSQKELMDAMDGFALGISFKNKYDVTLYCQKDQDGIVSGTAFFEGEGVSVDEESLDEESLEEVFE